MSLLLNAEGTFLAQSGPVHRRVTVGYVASYQPKPALRLIQSGTKYFKAPVRVHKEAKSSLC